jgi:hypothetical protein|nr:MAG TPA: hypothetical protein [Caudoviricetes sp.]
MVTAYNTRTGVFQDIPEHWIGHPIWGADWTLTPPPEAREPLCCGQEEIKYAPEYGDETNDHLTEGD